MACNCGRQAPCGDCSRPWGSAAPWFFSGAPEVSKFTATLSSAFLATHTSCCGGCLTLVGGRYRCGAFSANSGSNQKPYCPYGTGAPL